MKGLFNPLQTGTNVIKLGFDGPFGQGCCNCKYNADFGYTVDGNLLSVTDLTDYPAGEMPKQIQVEVCDSKGNVRTGDLMSNMSAIDITGLDKTDILIKVTVMTVDASGADVCTVMNGLKVNLCCDEGKSGSTLVPTQLEGGFTLTGDGAKPPIVLVDADIVPDGCKVVSVEWRVSGGMTGLLPLGKSASDPSTAITGVPGTDFFVGGTAANPEVDFSVLNLPPYDQEATFTVTKIVTGDVCGTSFVSAIYSRGGATFKSCLPAPPVKEPVKEPVKTEAKPILSKQ